jgi:hypothetical protein
MRLSRLNRTLLASIILCAIVAFLLCRLSGLENRWRNVKDGMSQAEVAHSLGAPSSTNNTQTIGAGGRLVTRWVYKEGRRNYCVDFDYVGPGGAPVVYRTERYIDEWRPPSWWPWVHWWPWHAATKG